MSEGATVYILRCADGSLYVGITRRTIEERLSEHAQGISKGYTQSRRPVELLHSEHYERADEAVAAERRLKGWSRAKKIAYMRGDFEALHVFAERRGRVGRQLEPSSFDTAASRPAQDEGT